MRPPHDKSLEMQAIAQNDRSETEWSDFLRGSDAVHLCDIFSDLRLAEEALRLGTTPDMLTTVNAVCMHPMSVAALRLAVGLAVIRVRTELVERAKAAGKPAGGETEADA